MLSQEPAFQEAGLPRLSTDSWKLCLLLIHEIAQGTGKYRDFCSISASLYSSNIPDSHSIFSGYMWCNGQMCNFLSKSLSIQIARFFRKVHWEPHLVFSPLPLSPLLLFYYVHIIFPETSICSSDYSYPVGWLEAWWLWLCGARSGPTQSLLAQALCHASCVHTASGQVGCERKANMILFGMEEENLGLCGFALIHLVWVSSTPFSQTPSFSIHFTCTLCPSVSSASTYTFSH